MHASRNPVEVLTVLRIAEQLLIEQADEARRHAVSRPDCGSWGPISRYRQLLETAAALRVLAAKLATEAERRV